MSKRRSIISVIVFVAALFTVEPIATILLPQKAAVPKPHDKFALGEDEVRQLLLVIGKDKNGKITTRVDEVYGCRGRQAG